MTDNAGETQAGSHPRKAVYSTDSVSSTTRVGTPAVRKCTTSSLAERPAASRRRRVARSTSRVSHCRRWAGKRSTRHAEQGGLRRTVGVRGVRAGRCCGAEVALTVDAGRILHQPALELPQLQQHLRVIHCNPGVLPEGVSGSRDCSILRVVCCSPCVT